MLSGGSKLGQLSNAVTVHYVNKDMVRNANNLVTARQFHASTSLGYKVYVFGGESKDGLENSME